MSSIPTPSSCTSIVSSLSLSSHFRLILPSLPSYPWTIQFVTASDTAVFISEISSNVGSNLVQNAATTTLAKLSFSDLIEDADK